MILPFLGIMAMTWGDGMAAVIGRKFSIKQIRHEEFREIKLGICDSGKQKLKTKKVFFDFWGVLRKIFGVKFVEKLVSVS